MPFHGESLANTFLLPCSSVLLRMEAVPRRPPRGFLQSVGLCSSARFAGSVSVPVCLDLRICQSWGNAPQELPQN